MYTLKDLEENNYRSHITQTDVETVNNLVQFIQKSRNSEIPQVGDIIEYTNEQGDYFGNAHVDKVKGSMLYICERPSAPFVSKEIDGDELHVSTSGGSWTHIPRTLRYVGKRKKAFIVSSHMNILDNGFVQFHAEVNVWEYVTNPKLKFTTKTHDRFSVFVNRESGPNEYKYLIRKDGTPHTAFKTTKEYWAWLRTFRGVERKGVHENSRTVWTFKTVSKCIPLEEYESINDVIIDSELSNATIQECKRIYEGSSVITFLPYQNQKIKLVTGVKRYEQAYGMKSIGFWLLKSSETVGSKTLKTIKTVSLKVLEVSLEPLTAALGVVGEKVFDKLREKQ